MIGMQITFIPGPGVKVVHSEGEIINEPGTGSDNQVSAEAAVEESGIESLFKDREPIWEQVLSILPLMVLYVIL